jgi:hypothetical protein
MRIVPDGSAVYLVDPFTGKVMQPLTSLKPSGQQSLGHGERRGPAIRVRADRHREGPGDSQFGIVERDRHVRGGGGRYGRRHRPSSIRASKPCAQSAGTYSNLEFKKSADRHPPGIWALG